MPKTIHLVHAYFTHQFATKMFLPTDGNRANGRIDHPQPR